jgi:hypothetical protein
MNQRGNYDGSPEWQRLVKEMDKKKRPMPYNFEDDDDASGCNGCMLWLIIICLLCWFILYYLYK